MFKIEFADLTSRTRNPAGVHLKKREIRPNYFFVTDNRIVLLNGEDNVSPAATSTTRRENGERQSN